MQSQELNNQEIKIEDLLKQVKPSDPTIEKIEDPMVRFLTFFNIQSGRYKIRIKLLYKLFCSFGSTSLNQKEFTTKLGLFFPIKRGTISISKHKFKLSNEAYRHLVEQQSSKGFNGRVLKQFENYIKYYNIQSGSMWMELYCLYYLYRKWRFRQINTNEMGYTYFRELVRNYFTTNLEKKVWWVQVDDSIKQHLSDELRRTIIQDRIKWAQRRKPKIRIRPNEGQDAQ